MGPGGAGWGRVGGLSLAANTKERAKNLARQPEGGRDAFCDGDRNSEKSLTVIKDLFYRSQVANVKVTVQKVGIV